MFVDDPRASVELAASLVDDSIEAHIMSIKEQQQSLLSGWRGDGSLAAAAPASVRVSPG